MNTTDQEVRLGTALNDYEESVNAWLDTAKKQTAAINKLHKAVMAGNVRDMEKLRQNARQTAEFAIEKARECGSFDFDIEAYLNNGYLSEFQEAAEAAGVQIFERDGIIFCYPMLVRLEPELTAARIDKKLDANIRPEVLAGVLKKAQSRDPKAKPERFVETLFEAYELLRAKKHIDHPTDLLLRDIYKVLTLLPGSGREYTLLDFTRDLYFLDISDTSNTKKGAHLGLTSSTVSREDPKKVLTFVTRDGHEKQYASVKFTPRRNVVD